MRQPTEVRGADPMEGETSARPRYHCSVDDVFDAFIDVSDRRIPLFEHPFFGFLAELHREFDAAFDLYVFYQKMLAGRRRTLDEVSDAIGDALRRNPWLRLGPHALDYDSPPYAQDPEAQIRTFDAIYAQLERFARGGGRSAWVRLHYFSESHELADYFTAKGVEALLTTDKAPVSYRLPAAAAERLRERGAVEYGGLTLRRSHLRIERLVEDGLDGPGMRGAVDSILEQHECVVLLTHECELARPEVRGMMASVLRHLTARRATSV